MKNSMYQKDVIKDLIGNILFLIGASMSLLGVIVAFDKDPNVPAELFYLPFTEGFLIFGILPLIFGLRLKISQKMEYSKFEKKVYSTIEKMDLIGELLFYIGACVSVMGTFVAFVKNPNAPAELAWMPFTEGFLIFGILPMIVGLRLKIFPNRE